MSKKTTSSRYKLSISNLLKPRNIISLLLIGLTIGLICIAFAYTAGWLTPNKLTPNKIVNRFEHQGGIHPGFRRNHAKGICVSGYFTSNGKGQTLSKALVFKPGKTPVFGRFAFAGSNPHFADNTNQVRSIALNFTQANGEVWRSGQNNIPVFTVKNAQGFYDLLKASRPDPATGKPNPAAMKVFFKAHPESAVSIPLIKSRPISSGFNNASYNSLNAFLFTNASGKTSPVRWSFVPVDAFYKATPRKHTDKNYLFNDLIQRINKKPLQFHLIITIANKNDPINDATKPWPKNRKHVDVGTLTLNTIDDENHSQCNDVNFDPLILPSGIKASNDPILSARSAAYSNSFTRREGEAKQRSAVITSTKTPNT